MTTCAAVDLDQDALEREQGSLSVFFAVAALAVLIVVGLVVDGGGVLSAREHANDLAAQAARQGAEAVQAGAVVRGQGGQIDPTQAIDAAQNFLRAAGVSGTVTIDSATELTVNITITYKPVMLGLIGVGPKPEHGHATVRLQTGG